MPESLSVHECIHVHFDFYSLVQTQHFFHVNLLSVYFHSIHSDSPTQQQALYHTNRSLP